MCVRLDGQSAASIDFCFFVFVNNVTKYKIITYRASWATHCARLSECLQLWLDEEWSV